MSPTAFENHADCSRNSTLLFLLLFFLISLGLGAYKLNYAFPGSESAKLACMVTVNPGWLWMRGNAYGILIILITKVFVSLLELLRINITEFWWRVPALLFGSLLVFPVYLLTKEISRSKTAALFAAAMVAVLPVHIMFSRFSFSFEGLGIFFLTIAVYTCIRYFENPNPRSAIYFSTATTLYLLSHAMIWGYPVLVCWIGLITISEGKPINKEHLVKFIKLIFRKEILLLPIIVVPLLAPYSLITAFARGRYHAWGFYLPANLKSFVGNIGIFWFSVLVLASIAGAYDTFKLKRDSIPFVWGAIYLAPFVFKVKPTLTMEGGYMMNGTVALTIYAGIVLARLKSSGFFRQKLNIITPVLGMVFILTLAASICAIFGISPKFQKISMVRLERQVFNPNPGYKTGGYYIRKYVPPGVKIINMAMDTMSSFYYLGRDVTAFNERDKTSLVLQFNKLISHMEVVIISADQRGYFGFPSCFSLKARVLKDSRELLLIYAKQGLHLPSMSLDVEKYDPLFDDNFSWKPMDYHRTHPDARLKLDYHFLKIRPSEYNKFWGFYVELFKLITKEIG
jgi:hypothetical protein